MLFRPILPAVPMWGGKCTFLFRDGMCIRSKNSAARLNKKGGDMGGGKAQRGRSTYI